MAHREQRALLFVVDNAQPAVDLVAELFRPRPAESATELRTEGPTGDRGELLAQLLQEDGYELGIMVSGAEASRRLACSPRPDALVVDVSTPQGGALEVAFEARRRYPNLPVFVITSYPELIATAQQQLLPRATVFEKPVDYAEFSFALALAARKHSGEYVRIPAFLANTRTSTGRS